MPKYYYVVDTSITNGSETVGQNTYDALVNERLSHGVVQ